MHKNEEDKNWVCHNFLAAVGLDVCQTCSQPKLKHKEDGENKMLNIGDEIRFS